MIILSKQPAAERTSDVGLTHEIRCNGEWLWRGDAMSMNLMFANLAGCGMDFRDSAEYEIYLCVMEREANNAGASFAVRFEYVTIEFARIGDWTALRAHRFGSRSRSAAALNGADSGSYDCRQIPRITTDENGK